MKLHACKICKDKSCKRGATRNKQMKEMYQAPTLPLRLWNFTARMRAVKNRLGRVDGLRKKSF